MEPPKDYWKVSASPLLEGLGSSEKGLSSAEAQQRLATAGQNEIAAAGKRGWPEILLAQFKNPLIFVLIAAAVVSFFLGDANDATVILSIVFLNALLGFYQEYKAERALDELRKYVSMNVKVLRDGFQVEVDSRKLVTGDIVFLNIGDVVPADIRLLSSEGLSSDESTLTGESLPVPKKHGESTAAEAIPQNLANVLFMGSSVSSGLCTGVVVATGKHTFFGKTAAYLKHKPHETYFQQSIRDFGGFLLKIVLAMTAFIFIANAVLGKGVFDSFLFAVALAVGITPEALPVVMTISLSNGAMRMAKEKVITKRLASVEDFGNIDTLCSDKTGTLTEGEVSLEGHLGLDGNPDRKVLLYGLLCNSAKRARSKHSFGNPIDKAIWKSKEAGTLSADFASYSLVSENEFDFERRRMSVVVNGKEGTLLIAKGAFESIFSASSFALVGGKILRLSPELSQKLLGTVDSYEREGYNVIAVAEKIIGNEKATKEDETDLIVLGMMLFLDPAKPTAREALRTLKSLRVDVKILSGDSATVTRKICSDVGLQVSGDRVVLGEELAKMSDSELKEFAVKYNVFARVTPEQKYKVVSALNHEGHIVGFIGDGVNDLPALKAADVGITVDSASGIAKDAADIILLKKSLKVLAQGITEGRKTFANTMKYILNSISSNYGNMFTIAASSLFLRFIPLLPSQILLTNFTSDFPFVAISTDKVDREMLKKPKRWNMKLISKFMVYFGLMSCVFDLLTIYATLYVFKLPEAEFRTAWFVESVFSELMIPFAIRTRMPFYKSIPSRLLMAASALAGTFTIFIVYSSLGTQLFHFVALPLYIVATVAGILVLYFIVAEAGKRWFFSKYEL